MQDDVLISSLCRESLFFHKSNLISTHSSLTLSGWAAAFVHTKGGCIKHAQGTPDRSRSHESSVLQYLSLPFLIFFSLQELPEDISRHYPTVLCTVPGCCQKPLQFPHSASSVGQCGCHVSAASATPPSKLSIHVEIRFNAGWPHHFIVGFCLVVALCNGVGVLLYVNQPQYISLQTLMYTCTHRADVFLMEDSPDNYMNKISWIMEIKSMHPGRK